MVRNVRAEVRWARVGLRLASLNRRFMEATLRWLEMVAARLEAENSRRSRTA